MSDAQAPPAPQRPQQVAAYFVVSDDAAEAKAQREALVAFAKRQGEMGAVYTERRKFKRPKWQLLTERARKGEVDLVCVFKLEDLSPSAGCVARMVVDVGVRVLAVDGVAADPQDAWLRWVAEGRERRQKHSRRTVERRRERGERVGEISFGWQLGSDGLLVPCPAEQATIARAIELRQQGTTFQRIAEILNQEEHHARGGKRIYRGQASRWQRAKQG